MSFAAFAAPDAGGLTALASSGLSSGEVGLEFPVLDADAVARLTAALRGRHGFLAEWLAERIATVLGRVGARFLDGDDPLRREALALLPSTSGLSPEMSELVLDGMAADWTADRLRRLLATELADPCPLDGFVTKRDRRAMAVGPPLCVQIVSGSVPGVGVTALIRSLLVKSPTLLKPGRGDVVLPVLFARALRAEDSGLADALAVVYWPGGSTEVEDAAMAGAGVVTAYGSDQTVASLRARAPATTRFVAYHHRISVGAVGAASLGGSTIEASADEVALAVAVFDQRGCVSPQVVYVEETAETSAERFAEVLAGAFGRLEARLPGGVPDAAEASAMQQLRGTAELLAASGSGAVHHGGPDATWTVVVERTPGPMAACVGRVVRIRPLADAAELPHLLEPWAEHVQTLGVAGFGARLEGLAAECGRIGVSRVAPFASVAFPPPWWLHDGRGPLTDLLRWVELERE